MQQDGFSSRRHGHGSPGERIRQTASGSDRPIGLICTVVVVPMTSDLRPDAILIRRRIKPSDTNGLQLESDLMIDKISAISRSRVGKTIGRITPEEMAELTVALALFLGYS